MTYLAHRVSVSDLMTVTVPEGTSNHVDVRKFTVERYSLQNYKLGSRGTSPGDYTAMDRNGHVWMSDTDAEKRDHYEPAWQIQSRGGRILIGGLGLGMILRVALLTEGVTHVDVVELDEDVIALVGPHYEAMAAEHGISLVIHHADMYKITWPAGTRWDVAWFDIWRDLCTDNLATMTKLRRSYGRRTDWNDCWGRELLISERRREARSPWGGWR